MSAPPWFRIIFSFIFNIVQESIVFKNTTQFVVTKYFYPSTRGYKKQKQKKKKKKKKRVVPELRFRKQPRGNTRVN